MKENILIVYYSYSGKTRRIAEEIQRQTGGRISQIYPRQPYPADFESLLKQVREENRSGKLPALLPITESVGAYDIVFTGSPNWCGTIAPPLAAWLDKSDMTGKVILPGVTIGDYAVIGAGSVVTRSIPEKAVAFGNPCRVHRYLDAAEK